MIALWAVVIIELRCEQAAHFIDYQVAVYLIVAIQRITNCGGIFFCYIYGIFCNDSSSGGVM